MDEHYHHPALVALYDAANAARRDFEFYLAQAPDPPAHILDIGCGTGTLALDLAMRGHSVTAVDPAPEMIAAARAKLGADRVRWLIGRAHDLPQDASFDTAFMTGHAFQCLHHDIDIVSLFEAVESRLCKGGSFWFETRNRDAQPWTRWSPAHAAPPILLADGRRAQVIRDVREVSGEFVTLEETYHLSDQAEPLTARSVLRFAALDHLRQLAGQAGFRVADLYGDWAKGAFDATSPEIILRLEKHR